MNAKYYLLPFLLLGIKTSIGQNLIKNGGFEEVFYTNLENDSLTYSTNNGSMIRSNGIICLDWYMPIMDLFRGMYAEGEWGFLYSTDFYYSKIPNDLKDSKNIHEGYGALGLFVGDEFACTRLKEPLIKGKEYSFSFYSRMGYYSAYSEKYLGFIFTKDSNFKVQRPLNPFEEVYYIKSKGINRVYWKKLEFNFKAKGGEEYLLIGIGKKRRIKRFDKGYIRDKYMNKNPAYYLFDNFTLEAINPNNNQKSTDKISHIETVLIDSSLNIEFKLNSHEIDSRSLELINLFTDFIEPKLNGKKYIFEIYGYTDTTGDSLTNYLLSERRSIAVGQEIQKILPNIEIKINAKGETEPIFINGEYSAILSRRVKIKVVLKN